MAQTISTQMRDIPVGEGTCNRLIAPKVAKTVMGENHILHRFTFNNVRYLFGPPGGGFLAVVYLPVSVNMFNAILRLGGYGQPGGRCIIVVTPVEADILLADI